ncbi:MAG TPA: glucose-1-phosphate thymidylyltransferase [Candidatus Binatia bacterium]|jgi:glucose-1-phosphate thymidylyltransferase
MSSAKLKGLILSGGRGTRLRPLTHTAAKQLVPVANRPIIFYVLDNLAEAGIQETAVIISPETGKAIENSVGDGRRWGMTIEYILQHQPLGLAHAVKIARLFLGATPFIMYLGDNLIGTGIRDFAEDFEQSTADATILLKAVNDPSSFGIAEIDSSGRVIRLIEKPKEPQSNLALVGIYFFSNKIHGAIDRIRPSWRGELEITDALQELLQQGSIVLSHELECWWLDTGKKDDLLTANTAVLDEWIKRRIDGEADSRSQVTGRVQLGTGSRIVNSTVRGPVVLGEDVFVENSFIGPFTSIGNGCQIISSVLEHCVLLENARIERIDRLEDSLIGRNSTVIKNHHTHQAYRLMIGDDSEVLL